MLYGDDINYEQELLYRQPRNTEELRAVTVAAQEYPWAGWACDGDAHLRAYCYFLDHHVAPVVGARLPSL